MRLSTPFAATLLIITLGARAGAQQASPLRAAADSAFQQQDWPRAKTLYESLAKQDTMNGTTWFRLGVAAHNTGDVATAETGYTHALALRFQPGQAAFRLARVAIVKGMRDSSIALLGSAMQFAGTNLHQQIEAEKDFAPILGDPKYKRLLAVADSVAHPCRSSAKAHQFDFWVGDWDVSPWGQPAPPPQAPKSFNSVQLILENCALLENWRAAGGSEGKSFNVYDPNIARWRQLWIGDGGGALDYTGEYRDGAMRFEGWTLNTSGSHTLQKLTFFNIHPDTVRQLFEASTDSGKTWQSTFDGRYVRRRKTP